MNNYCCSTSKEEMSDLEPFLGNTEALSVLKRNNHNQKFATTPSKIISGVTT